VRRRQERFTLRRPWPTAARRWSASAIWKKYGKWPVYSKFFDNMGPIPHHMHQSAKQAKLVGQEGKPESYYFPPQHNNVGNNFPYTFMGFEPGTTKEQVRKCLATGTRATTASSTSPKAYRLKSVPAGSLIRASSTRPAVPLHLRAAVGQRRLRHVSEPRRRPRSAVVAARQRHAQEQAQGHRLHRRPARLGQERGPELQGQPLPRTRPRRRHAQEGFVDRWIVYGKVDGEQLFTAKELTVEPGAKCTIQDGGAYGLICVQGKRPINGQPSTARSSSASTN
jgi:hypothetical protein